MTSGESRVRDIVTGLLTCAFGGAAAVASLGYSIGGFADMGPGLFPLVVALLLLALGAALLVSALRSERGPSRILPARAQSGVRARSVLAHPAFSICGGVLVFALLLERVGLPIATAAMIVTGAASDRRIGIVRMVALAALMGLGSSLLFVEGLGLPLPLLGSWFD